MRHLIIVLLVAGVTLTIVFAIYRPDLLEGAWLWIVGLAGPVIGTARVVFKRINSFFQSLDKSEKIPGK